MKTRILIILPFIAAIAAIVALMPHGGRFKYHFQKGKQWKYQTLIADFDFPLYKSNAEIEQERNALLNSLLPYYQCDSAIAEQQIARLSADIISLLKKEPQSIPSPQWLPQITSIVRYVYDKGIRNNNPIAESFLDSAEYFYVVKAHFAVPTAATETFLPHEAAQYVRTHIDGMRDLNAASIAFLQKIQWESYIVPNLLYDSPLTTAAQNERLRLLSPTYGMVGKGERIIAQGDLINASKYGKLESYRKEYELNLGFSGNIWLLLLGQVLLVCLLMGLLAAYLYFFQKRQLTFKNSAFVLMLIVLFCGLLRWVSGSGVSYIYIVPFALLATYVCTFLGHRLAIMVQIIAILLGSMIVQDAYEFILLNLPVSIVAIYFAKRSYQRSSLYMSAVVIFATYCLLYFAQTLISEGKLDNLSLLTMAYFAINAGLVIAGSQFMFVLEKMFRYLSNTTLMEISDTNQPLLRLLAEKAPATFQHSLQVANLAETAVSKIGGNPLLVRAGALYHDIGKLQNPSYFIENQTLGYNPHKTLAPEESAAIIIKHVSDGVSIATKYRLPAPIIDFISTHHGASKTRYFYRIYKEQHPDAADTAAFTYTGTNPATIEQAVLMLADVTEAASRMLTSYSHENIDTMVENAIDTVMGDNLLSNSLLAFADIGIIKAVFKKKMQNMYHARTRGI